MKVFANAQVRTFVILTLLLIVSRTADAATTYMVTPDLKRELNPIVSVLGGGWTQLILAQIVGSVLVLGVAFWEIFSPALPYPSERRLSYREFIDRYYFGRKVPVTDYLWRFPKSLRLNLKVLGYALPRILIVFGFYLAISSFASVYSTLCRHFLHITFPYLNILIVASLIFWSMYRFSRREYNSYRLIAAD